MAKEKYIWLSGLRKDYNKKVRAHVLQQRMLRKKSCDPKEDHQEENAGTSTELARYAGAPENVIYSKDVLETMTVHLGRRERYLVHHFATYNMTSVFRLDASTAHFNPPGSISFPRWAHDRTALFAMATSAAYETSILLCGKINDDALRMETKALRSLYERMQLTDSYNTKLSILLVIVFISRDVEAAPQEFSLLRETILRHHIIGMRHLIKQFGGIEPVVRDPQVGWTLHWYDLLTAGELTIGLSPDTRYSIDGSNIFSTSLKINHLLPIGGQSDNQQTVLSSAVSELVGLYDSMYRIFGMRANTVDAESPHTSFSSRCQAIDYHHHAVTPPHLSDTSFDQTQAPSLVEAQVDKCKALLILKSVKVIFDDHPRLFQALEDVEGNPKFARLAAIIYLAAKAVLLFHEEDSTIARYFANLRKFLCAQNLEQAPFIWCLVMVLITDHDTFAIEDPQTLWLTSRILWVSKALTVQLAREVEQIFFLLLFNSSTMICSEDLPGDYDHPGPYTPLSLADKLLPLIVPGC